MMRRRLADSEGLVIGLSIVTTLLVVACAAAAAFYYYVHSRPPPRRRARSLDHEDLDDDPYDEEAPLPPRRNPSRACRRVRASRVAASGLTRGSRRRRSIDADRPRDRRAAAGAAAAST